jgi:hypothetical protein
MSQPFSGIPDPGSPSPFKRRVQPNALQETLQGALRKVQRYGEDALRGARRHGEDLWRRGKRHPRTVALSGAAVVVTLVGAYALSASSRSLCPPAGEAKAPRFLLLMDPIPHPTAGSELTINYDLCGLKSGTPYRGKVRLAQQPQGKKKKSVKPKPLVVTFQDKVDGPATRRSQELNLGRTKPGTYTLELSVVDNHGRERKRLQKVLVKAQ